MHWHQGVIGGQRVTCIHASWGGFLCVFADHWIIKQKCSLDTPLQSGPIKKAHWPEAA